jgi:hypothetical protein
VKGQQDFSIFSCGGYFCSKAEHPGDMVLITPVKFVLNPTSSLTYEGRTSSMRTDRRGRQKQFLPKILGNIIMKLFVTK